MNNLPSLSVDGLGIFGPLVALSGLASVIVSVLILVLNVILALAVNGDAKRLRESNAGLFLVGPFLWGCIAFLFSLAGVAVYWAIHHSNLRNAAPPGVRTP